MSTIIRHGHENRASKERSQAGMQGACNAILSPFLRSDFAREHHGGGANSPTPILRERVGRVMRRYLRELEILEDTRIGDL